MASFATKTQSLSGKSNPAAFIECNAEVLRSAVHTLKTNDTTKSVGTTWEGLGVFTPTFILVVATTITALVTQPEITFQGQTFVCTMTAANDYAIFWLDSTNRTAIATNSDIFFTVAVLANATTYEVRAFVGGFYTRL